MKRFILTVILGLLFATSCNKPLDQELISDPTAHHMKIIPDNPGTNDEIRLIVYDDCTYNILSGINRNGTTIDIQKQFNGMMKWPCMIRNDTILIGKLPEGTFTIHYKLTDIGYLKPDIVLSLTFILNVSR
jgi:hypothetical protein